MNWETLAYREQRKARVIGKKVLFQTSNMKGAYFFKEKGKVTEGFSWPANIIEKIPLLPDWSSEPLLHLVYVCDLPKEEVFGLSSSGAVSSDVAWSNFSFDQFCHGFTPVPPCLGCCRYQWVGFPVTHCSVVVQHREQSGKQPLVFSGSQDHHFPTLNHCRSYKTTSCN